MLRKKLLAIMIAAMAVLTACGSEAEQNTEDTADTTQAAETVSNDIILTEGQKSLYKIIRADEASEDLIDAAVDFRKDLEELTGVKFQFGTDWVKPGDAADDESFEILFGLTNRTASQKFMDELSGIEYGISVDGNKIIIGGDSVHTLEMAADLFLKGGLVNLNDEGKYTLTGVPVTKIIELADNEVPPYPASNIEYYVPSTDTNMMKIHDTTAEGYNEYLECLEAAGFVRYTDNKIGNNLFATYTSDTLTVNAYYIDTNKITRIIWEPKGALPILEADNVYERKVDTLITNIDLETTMFYEGASHVIRLCDGSFIIIDGGASDYDGVECEKMMNILKEQSPDEKPIIAAWLFSHCHGDHIGLMGDFLKNYHDQVIIESFVYNFPTDEEIAPSHDAYMLDDSHFRYNAFRNSKNEYFADVPVIKPHTGNVLYIRNATIEILGTEEDIYPHTIITHGMNASTVYYKMHLEGQSIMWLGDSAAVNCEIGLEQFGDYFKSDIMQVAHHGYGGGTIPMYSTVDPTYVIYPVAKESYVGNYTNETNKWFLEDSENVKLVMTTGFGTYTMKMPFSVPDGKYERCQPRRFKEYVNPEVFE